MSSREIADLLGARPDSVKRTIERLADRCVVELPPLEGVKNHLGQTVEEYRLDKRSSLIVVAQLSPEFTARVVDRWQELEAQLAQPPAPQFAIPQTLPEALRLVIPWAATGTLPSHEPPSPRVRPLRLGRGPRHVRDGG